MLEQRLAARFPAWFRGRRARLARPLLHGVRRWTRLHAVEAFLRASPGVRGLALVRAALDHLGSHYVAHGVDAAVPARGPCVVVANHPSGALDALALLDALGRVRSDVRVVANAWLHMIDGLRPLLLPVDVFGRGAAAANVRAIDAALARGECVLLFPAGEVARLGLRGVREGRWRDGFARLARRHAAPVVPVRVQARNSALFYGTSALLKPAATWLLAREMYARRAQPLRLTFGVPTRVDTHDATADVARRLRRWCATPAARVAQRDGECIADALAPVDAGPLGAHEPLPPPQTDARLRVDVQTLTLLGRTTDGKQIRAGRLEPGCALMLELGRLRELTFRAVGEGTGRARDIDRFDAHYDHIVLWDDGAARIAGAYRVGRVADLLARSGLPGLYTSTLFDFDASAVARLAAGLELGRSFVVPDYWGSRSIDYLWQGIGVYLRSAPWARYLFGPVSISASLPDAARRDVVAFYARWHGGEGGVRARRPYALDADDTARAAATDADTAFAALRARLACLGASVPMLYKQYADLCEPGGARFLAFNVDPDFSDVIDGLVEVDLARLRPAKRARYVGACGETTGGAGASVGPRGGEARVPALRPCVD